MFQLERIENAACGSDRLKIRSPCDITFPLLLIVVKPYEKLVINLADAPDYNCVLYDGIVQVHLVWFCVGKSSKLLLVPT